MPGGRALRFAGSSEPVNDGGCVDLRHCSRTSAAARLAVIVATVAVGVACGQPAAPAPPADPAPAASEGGGHGGHGGGHRSHGSGAVGTELWRVATGPLGVVVTDGDGHYVYRSDRDSADPPTSTCTDACADTWHPLVVEPGEDPTLLGIEPSTIGTLARTDGTTQLTLAGWPLYLRAGEPGGLRDAGSNGADGVWFAITPEGGKASAP
jgi:predicted lipoprotein with Yx(FWY)xxD motif